MPQGQATPRSLERGSFRSPRLRSELEFGGCHVSGSGRLVGTTAGSASSTRQQSPAGGPRPELAGPEVRPRRHLLRVGRGLRLGLTYQAAALLWPSARRWASGRPWRCPVRARSRPRNPPRQGGLETLQPRVGQGPQTPVRPTPARARLRGAARAHKCWPSHQRRPLLRHAPCAPARPVLPTSASSVFPRDTAERTHRQLEMSCVRLDKLTARKRNRSPDPFLISARQSKRRST